MHASYYDATTPCPFTVLIISVMKIQSVFRVLVEGLNWGIFLDHQEQKPEKRAGIVWWEIQIQSI